MPLQLPFLHILMVLHGFSTFPRDHRRPYWVDTTKLTPVPFYMNHVTSQNPKGCSGYVFHTQR